MELFHPPANHVHGHPSRKVLDKCVFLLSQSLFSETGGVERSTFVPPPLELMFLAPRPSPLKAGTVPIRYLEEALERMFKAVQILQKSL